MRPLRTVVALVEELLLDVRVAGEEPEGEGEGVGGGLVAGEKDGEALVADLGVGHAGFSAGGGGFGVGGGEEHAEEVAAVYGVGATFADHAVDEGVELGAAAADAAHGGERRALEEGGEWEEGEGEKALEGVDCCGDLVNVFFEVGVEEGFADDAEGEEEHLVAKVEDRCCPPSFASWITWRWR